MTPGRRGIARWLRLPFRSRDAIHADVDAELDALIASRVEHLVARGMPANAAYAEALRRLGASVEQARAQLHQSAEHRERQMRLVERLETVAQDIRYALRGLAQRPAFTAVVVLTLAIGIGATTAIFSAVNTLLLRPLPYPNPDELMKVTLVTPARAGRPGNDQMVWSYPKYRVFRDAQRVFSDVALYSAWQFTMKTNEAERVPIEFVGATYFPLIGVPAVRGRVFDRSLDAHPDAERQAVLTYSLWQSHFNADPSIIGRTVDLDRAPFTIIGVAAPGFAGLTGQAKLFVPLTVRPADDLGQAMSHEFWMVARRAPGVTVERAEAEVRALGARVDAAYPSKFNPAPWGATAEPLDNARLAPAIKRSLLVLFGAVGFVLLIACANVANLLFGRAGSRSREIAVRLAWGASRARLVRLLMTESVVLALFGAAASITLSWLGVRALGQVDPATTLRVSRDSGLGAIAFSTISLDWRALAFTLGVAVAVGLLFGLVPAIGASRASLTDALKEGRRRAGRGSRASMRRWLVTLEVALAVMLLAGSGLMIRSLANLLAAPFGFDASHVLTLRVSLPVDGPSRDSMPGFYEQLVERVRGVPGVLDASLSNCAPLSGGCNATSIQFLERPEASPDRAPTVGINWISPTWFSTLRVPVVRGRGFTNADGLTAPRVALVNDAAAKAFWPGENPIGKRIALGQGGLKDVEVVGIVGGVRQRADSAPKPDVYVSYLQAPRPGAIIFVRTAGDPSAAAGAIRRAIQQVAPAYPLFDVRTMTDRVAAATAQTRFTAVLLALFATTALSLAAIGIYGVMSLAVADRTREIGVRVALGADGRLVRRLVVGEGMVLAAAGAAIGLVGAVVATRVLRAFLFELEPTDPTTYFAILVILGLAAVAASWIPARRAARVDPVVALRAE